ncbi:MAG TPA: HAMP domain-containing sensor histidine kinase [Isosphaeraceae bacterium]
MRSDVPVGPPDRGKAAATLAELGHLASGVGHHVINAFSAVVSNAEILRIRMALPDPPDPIALADAIIRTSLEASAVALRLIDVTRPLTGVGTEEFALDALVADYVDERKAEGIEGVSWTAVAASVPLVLGDAEQIRSLLDHLTTNSIESAGRDQVEIALVTSVDSRGWVVLEVQDTARGMAPEVLERAVEPFFSTKAGHLGVGLSIANGIWRRHRGTLSVRSQPGEGTTVRLCVEPGRHRPATLAQPGLPL